MESGSEVGSQELGGRQKHKKDTSHSKYFRLSFSNFQIFLDTAASFAYSSNER